MTATADAADGGRKHQVRSFSGAVQSVLTLVQDRLGLEIAAVSRRQGDQYLVLDSRGGEGILEPGDVMPWSNTYCALMVAGLAPSTAPRLHDVPAYAELQAHHDNGLKALMTVPIRDEDGELFGTLCGYSRTEKPPALVDDEPLVQLWADMLGMVLSSELARDRAGERASRAEEEAETDPLTELGNRRLWDRLVAEEEARCRRYGYLAALAVIDLDNLKGINDERGHAAGDAELVRAGSKLRAVTGDDGWVVRLGGDEFAVLVPNCTRQRADSLLDELLAGLDDAGVRCSGGSAVRTPDTDLVATWRLADLEMYQAKRVARADLTRSADGGPRRRRVTDTGPRLFGPVAPSSRAVQAEIDDLLQLTREHMDSDVAIVAEIRDARWWVRNVSTRIAGWEPGLEQDAEATYCQRLLDGRIPEVIPDCSDLPDTVRLDWVPSPVGAYIGVPLSLADTGSMGTLCCVSAEPDLSLNQRDASFLHLVAQTVADLVAKEATAKERHHRAVHRIDQARRPGALEIAYQPVVDLTSRRPVGMEALTRLPGVADLAPEELFQAARDAGATSEIELHVAAMGLEGLAGVDGFLAINLSATTILDPGFHRLMAGTPVDRLVVEISEHTPIEDYDAVDAVLAPLRAEGLRVAIDDAGAGFASMRHVVRLRPDVIKLDISLIRNLGSDPISQRLTVALASFGREAGAIVVAEGVENEDIVELLLSLGITHGQGFHLGRPARLEA